MGDLVKVHEMYIDGELCWADGAGGAWRIRSLAEESHRLWAAEADRQTAVEKAARKTQRIMKESAELIAKNRAAVGPFPELDDSDERAAEILSAHRAVELKRVGVIRTPDESGVGYRRMTAAEKTEYDRNSEALAASRVAVPAEKPGDWAGHLSPIMLEAATRKDATEGAEDDDEELVQEGMTMYLKIEEAIEIHAKLDDAIHKDAMGTRVFLNQLKSVLVDLRKDMIGGDA